MSEEVLLHKAEFKKKLKKQEQRMTTKVNKPIGFAAVSCFDKC